MRPDLFYIPKRERVAILALAVILLFAGVVVCVCYMRPEEGSELTPADEAFLDSFSLEVECAHQMQRGRKAAEQTAELFCFDPNTVDSADMVRLGFAPWQIRNNLKYRARGGRWRSAEHFSHLYGLSAESFARLRPYVRIAPEPSSHVRKQADVTRVVVERPHYERVEKFRSRVELDANQVDTATLKKIPGIGSYYARKIVAYREALGGFVSKSQVTEIDGLPPDIVQWFRVSREPEVRKLRFNHMTFRQLVRHPYLNYEQVKAIFNVRRHTGFVNGWQALLLYDCFSVADVERLTPYVSFEP